MTTQLEPVAMIKPFTLKDGVLGVTVKLEVNEYRTILYIGRRDFVFDNKTGEMTGSGCWLVDPDEAEGADASS